MRGFKIAQNTNNQSTKSSICEMSWLEDLTLDDQNRERCSYSVCLQHNLTIHSVRKVTRMLSVKQCGEPKNLVFKILFIEKRQIFTGCDWQPALHFGWMGPDGVHLQFSGSVFFNFVILVVFTSIISDAVFLLIVILLGFCQQMVLSFHNNFFFYHYLHFSKLNLWWIDYITRTHVNRLY